MLKWRQTVLLAATMLVFATLSGHVQAQAGISTEPGATTGTIGTNKGAVAAYQCPTGTLLSGVQHNDIRMDIASTNSSYAARGMTGQVSLYCSRVSTDGTSVTVQQTTANGTPAVSGFRYPEAGIDTHAYCPAGRVAHQFGGWDRVTQGFPWASAARLACRPLQLNANSWVRVNTGVASINADAGNVETSIATHTSRGPFCSATNQTTIVSGIHRQAGGVGYDGINVYCGGLLQARFSAVMTFTDFAWNQTLGGSGWLVDLRRLAATLNDGGGNNGASRTPHPSVAANTNVFQSGREIYVVPNSNYNAQVSQRPSGIAANTHVITGTCLGTGITLANEQDASCTLNVHGLPDIGVSVVTTPLNYIDHGQTQNFTVTGTNHGPGAVEATDGFTLRATLPAGWTATAVPGCAVAGQVVTCAITSVLAAAPVPGGSGGSISFTFPVTVNAPTAPGTYIANLALGRSVPDGDSDPTNNDYNTANDTASGSLILTLRSRVTIRKISLDGIGSFSFTGSNGIANQTLVTTAMGTPVSGEVQILAATGTTTTIIEDVPPPGYVLTAIDCTGMPTGGVATTDLASRMVTLDAAATGAGANLVCTFTNKLVTTVRLQKSLPNGRFLADDQFVLSISSPASVPMSLTTTGSGSTADGVLVATDVANTTLLLSESGSGTTALVNYTTTYSCTNARAGGQTPNGSGASFTLTPVAGDDLTCTFANTALAMTDLSITKTNSETSLLSGTQTTYVIVARNHGTSSVIDAVVHDMPDDGLSDCVLAVPACEVTAGTAACPVVGSGTGQLSMTNLQDTGVDGGTWIPNMDMGGEVTIRVTCTVD